MKAFPLGGGSDPVETAAVAAGSTLGLQQEILAQDGQVGKTVLAVGYTYYDGTEGPVARTGVQVTSLEDGNVLFAYATGADFNAGVIQEGPVFLSKGQIYVFESMQPGSIVTATEGAHGCSQQVDGNNESPMPLMSLALGFTDTFVFAFRSSGATQGRIRIVNGPIASEVTLQTGAGVTVLGQENIPLEPWEFLTLSTNGNIEYRITATNTVMGCIHAGMDATPTFTDSKPVLPVTNDGLGWSRLGQMSAPYANTVVNWYVNDNVTGSFTVAGPGSPVDMDAAPPAGTGASDADYEPRGATRYKAAGLVSGYSGADSSGGEATPLCPVNTLTQRIAIPLVVLNSGDGGNNGIAIASPYKGTARLYQWNAATGVADLVTVEDPTGALVTDIQIIRRNGSNTVEFTPTTRDEQNIPASANISAAGGATGPGGDGGSHGFVSNFTGGYIEADVPCVVIFNSTQNANGGATDTFDGTSGAATIGISAQGDEQIAWGITPEEIRTEVREGTDGLLYKRQIGAGGTDTWVLA